MTRVFEKQIPPAGAAAAASSAPSSNSRVGALIVATFLISALLSHVATVNLPHLRALGNSSTTIATAPAAAAAAATPIAAPPPLPPRLSTAGRRAKRLATSWLRHLRASSPSGRIATTRIGCREYEAGAQSCVYEGFICINVSRDSPSGRPEVYFVDDTKEDFDQVPSDNWCHLRHQSADPRYYATRQWPILNYTVAPRTSCLNAFYRTKKSLLGRSLDRPQGADWTNEQLLRRQKVKWVDDAWLVDLDYADNNHNNHLLMDIIWFLDVVLWQAAVDLNPRPGLADPKSPFNDTTGHLFALSMPRAYLPQSEAQFNAQTSRDINRLVYALVLQLNLSRLYPDLTKQQLQKPQDEQRLATPLLEAYPELKQSERLTFHTDIRRDNTTNLVCMPRFTVGAKIGNGAHERVCRYMRRRSYELYGIPELPMTSVGQIYYPQPPKRIVILQRHISRGIENLDGLEKALHNAFDKYEVEIEVIPTDKVQTAEEHVRVFSRAGVLLTSHGSQSMGLIWMPRHSAIIEVMNVGYTDYAFNLLSESCKVWYYELQSLRLPGKPKKFYTENCKYKVPHTLNPCNAVKGEKVVVDIPDAVKTITLALERMGYDVGAWQKTMKNG